MKRRRKRKSKLLRRLLITLAIILIVVGLLAYYIFKTPKGFIEPQPVEGTSNRPYLTNVLMPQFYNGAQLGEPFEMQIVQEGVNGLIKSCPWPQETGGATFMTPTAYFVDEHIIIMGQVTIQETDFVATVVLKPAVNQQGLLDLKLVKVKLGELDVTFPARVIARKVLRQSITDSNISENDIHIKAAFAFLDGKPFDPVFKVEDKKVRLENVTLTPKLMTLALQPVKD